jgi:predicted phosphodiesterase
VRIAVIADIHANLAALEAILEDIDSQQVSEVFCLGDTIGYGPDPEEVIQELQKRKIVSVQGNHEYAIVNKAYFNRLNPDPKRSLELTLEMLSPESISYINSLEPVLVNNGARQVHGCPPKSPTAYLFFPSQLMLDKIFGSFPEALCFYGHTHTLNFFEEGLPPEKGLEIELGTYRLHPGRRYIINPGSVGQPRDGLNNHAKYLIWDQENELVTFRDVHYDVMRTVNRLRQLNFPSFNSQRLLL